VAVGKSQQEQVEHSVPTFERSIFELQSIVGQLEDGSLPLEESMQQFERGISLLRNCYQVLEHAEQRIEILTEIAEDGTTETKPFDASATFDSQLSAGASTGAAAADETDTTNEKKTTARKSRAKRGPTTDESLF
jgi:exodeoxyribonuclease VII small subunit